MSKVAPKDWESPDHLSLTERDFLVDRAETINGIVARSYLEVGQVLLQVKKKFKRDPDLVGWFKRWVEEITPITYKQAHVYTRIAEEVEANPEFASVVKDITSPHVFYEILTTKGVAQEVILDAIRNGEKVTGPDVKQIKGLPSVQLDRLKDNVESMEMVLFDLEMEALVTDNPYAKSQANIKIRQTKERLRKAQRLLSEKEAEVEELQSTCTTQEQVLQVLRKQIKQKEVVIENMSLDPVAKRDRALAQTVVDATKGLDLLLNTLDRYGTDKPELGSEAISTIERKMDLLKERLLEHYGTKT